MTSIAATTTTTTTYDRRVVLSTLWVFALFHYIYVDFLSMVLNPAAMTRMASSMSDLVMLGWMLVLEVAMLMIPLSRVLPFRVNRWANIVAGVLETLAVASTLVGGVARLSTLFYPVIEMACTVFIVWYAWTWRSDWDYARA